MQSRYSRATALAGALLLLSACAGEGSAGVAVTSASPRSWTSLAVDCPPLTAQGFSSTTPFKSPATGLEEPGQLRVMCSYRHRPEELPAVSTRLMIGLDAAYGDAESEVVTSDQARKKAAGQTVVELPGFEGLATASADGSGPVEVTTSSKNAWFFAIVVFDDSVESDAEIAEHADVLTTILRDMTGNLRSA